MDNVFFQSDLRQAIEDVAAQAGVNIIADPSVQGLVSVTIENATVDKALELLLAATDYQVEKTADYYLVYSPDVNSDFFTSVSETRMVKLQHVAPETARALLPGPLQQYVRYEPGSSRIAVTAPAALLDRILADLSKIDRGNGETVFMALEHIRAERARELLPENLQRFVRVDPERNTVAITAPAASSPVIVQQLRRLDIPLPANATAAAPLYPTRIIKLTHAPADSVTALLPAGMTEYVRADPTSNTVSISAPRHLIPQIEADIHHIDQPRQHVMLDARIVVLDRTEVLDFGTEFEWPTLSAGVAQSDLTAPDLPYELRLGYTTSREFTNALNITLNLLTQNDEATTIASPKVLAQDGVPSEIRVTTEEYFQITAQKATYVSAELEQIETGTILGITPRVGKDGLLTLDMNLEVSDVISRGRMDLPVVSRRTAKSVVQLENGGTAAVAGLVDSRTQTGRKGVPGLASIPLLGRTFRTDSLSHNARQVAIFVTATLVDQQDPTFRNSRPAPTSTRKITEEQYRAELRQALQTLGELQ